MECFFSYEHNEKKSKFLNSAAKDRILTSSQLVLKNIFMRLQTRSDTMRNFLVYFSFSLQSPIKRRR